MRQQLSTPAWNTVQKVLEHIQAHYGWMRPVILSRNGIMVVGVPSSHLDAPRQMANTFVAISLFGGASSVTFTGEELLSTDAWERLVTARMNAAAMDMLSLLCRNSKTVVDYLVPNLPPQERHILGLPE